MQQDDGDIGVRRAQSASPSGPGGSAPAGQDTEHSIACQSDRLRPPPSASQQQREEEDPASLGPYQSSAVPPKKRPKSSYYYGPPSRDSAFGTDPVGVIGRDPPREIVRIERDYSATEIPQFYPTFPLELEGRLAPDKFTTIICDINEMLLDAHSNGWALFDNTLAVLSLYLAPLVLRSKYKRELARLGTYIDQTNKELLNPAGLNIVHPRHTAFLFMEIEYF